MASTMSFPGEEILHLLVGGCRQLCLHKRGDGRIGHLHKVGASQFPCCLLFDRIWVTLNKSHYSHFSGQKWTDLVETRHLLRFLTNSRIGRKIDKWSTPVIGSTCDSQLICIWLYILHVCFPPKLPKWFYIYIVIAAFVVFIKYWLAAKEMKQ